jgi:hypothetical protein
MAYVPSVSTDNGVGCISTDGNTSCILSEEGFQLSTNLLTTPITATFGVNGLSTTNPAGLTSQSKLYYVNGINQYDASNNSIVADLSTGDMTITSATNQLLMASYDNTQINAGVGFRVLANEYIQMTAPSDITIQTTGAGGTYLVSNNLDVVCSAPNGGVALEGNLVNLLSQTTSSVIAPSGFYVGLSAFGTGDGTINGNLNGKVNLTNATANQNYTILVANANTGNQNIKGSGSDLNYNPVSQTLSVKNMIVSGNETQTGIITTNVLKTDIMYQQVSYTNTAVVNIPTTTALLAYGTFFMSIYDTGSILANSVVQFIFPTLPTDGSMDGYTFQLRKLRGGVNQNTQNWIFTALGNYILPNGNTLNTGSGGAVNQTSPNSFTQRFTIATYGSVGYYVGCNN